MSVPQTEGEHLILTVTRFELPHDKTIQNECAQQRLRSAWASAQSDQGLRCGLQCIAKDPSFLHADSGDSDQTGQMPRLIRVFAGRTLILLVLSCRGSFTDYKKGLLKSF